MLLKRWRLSATEEGRLFERRRSTKALAEAGMPPSDYRRQSDQRRSIASISSNAFCFFAHEYLTEVAPN